MRLSTVCYEGKCSHVYVIVTVEPDYGGLESIQTETYWECTVRQAIERAPLCLHPWQCPLHCVPHPCPRTEGVGEGQQVQWTLRSCLWTDASTDTGQFAQGDHTTAPTVK